MSQKMTRRWGDKIIDFFQKKNGKNNCRRTGEIIVANQALACGEQRNLKVAATIYPFAQVFTLLILTKDFPPFLK